jgi:hypothetical protein
MKPENYKREKGEITCMKFYSWTLAVLYRQVTIQVGDSVHVVLFLFLVLILLFVIRNNLPQRLELFLVLCYFGL